MGLHQAGWKVADIFRDLQKSGYQGTYQYLAAFLKAKTRPTSMTPVPSAQEREKTEMVKGILLLRNLVFHFCNRAIREVDPDFQDEAMGKMMALQAPGKRDQLTPKN